jgi:hypothetical protein
MHQNTLKYIKIYIAQKRCSKKNLLILLCFFFGWNTKLLFFTDLVCSEYSFRWRNKILHIFDYLWQSNIYFWCLTLIIFLRILSRKIIIIIILSILFLSIWFWIPNDALSKVYWMNNIDSYNDFVFKNMSNC